MGIKEKDSVSGVETTGHEWDGLKELNNPAPRWWLWVFLICCLFAFGYWYVFPAWPTLAGHTAGASQWTQYKKLNEEQAEIAARQAVWMEKFHKASFVEIQNDAELYEFAKAGGAAAFKEHCAACHGTGASGGKGYPNLNDDDWLWGGKVDDIYTTIKVGVRSTHPETRQNQMPAFGRDGLLKAPEIADVVAYVQSLSKAAAASTEAEGRGAQLFADQCAACHMEKGAGNRELGAPRLNDAIWLYGGDTKTLIATVASTRAGIMPTWEKRLSDDTIRQLAVYVHSLGGGE